MDKENTRLAATSQERRDVLDLPEDVLRRIQALDLGREPEKIPPGWFSVQQFGEARNPPLGKSRARELVKKLAEDGVLERREFRGHQAPHYRFKDE